MTWSTDRGPSKTVQRKLSSCNTEGGNVGRGSWFPVHGPRQDGLGTPGQVSCSENAECFVIRHGCKVALPVSSKFTLTRPQCGFAISALTYITFQNFTFVIYSTPKVVPFTVDFHKDLIKVPLPIRMTARLFTSFPSNL